MVAQAKAEDVIVTGTYVTLSPETAALPLADRYGRWNGFDSVDESDDAPDDRDRRWCARHHRSHYGASPHCVNPSRRPPQPTPTRTTFAPREDLNCVPVIYRTRESHTYAKAPPSPTSTLT